MTETTAALPMAHPAAGMAENGARILVLDDNEFDRVSIGRYLAKTDVVEETHYADSLDAFEKALAEMSYDLVLVDFRLTDGTGLDALHILRQSALNRNARAIMIAGDRQIEVAVTAMKDGCEDFIPKDTLSADLLRGSILKALKKNAAPGIGTELLQAQAHGVMEAIDAVGLAGLRPIITRMMRYSRQLRHAGLDDDQSGCLDRLDESCLELYGFMQSFSGEVAKRSGGIH